MSTQRFMSRVCKSPGRFTFVMLVGALLALQCLLPSAAFARSSGAGVASASPSSPSVYLRDKAGVSVVRLVATYGGGTVTCTGLGILVSSKETLGLSSAYQNFVLTDGSLVRPRGSSCGAAGSDFSLSNLQVWSSTEYTGSNGILLGSLIRCTAGKNTDEVAACFDGQNSTMAESVITPAIQSDSSYTYFTFQSDAGEPYLSLASKSAAEATIFNIGLTNSSGLIYPAKDAQGGETFKNYLIPAVVPAPPASQTGTQSSQSDSAAPNSIEGGTPEVNAKGELEGLFVNNGHGAYTSLPVSGLSELLQAPGFSAGTAVTSPQNCSSGSMVGACWNAGIDAFYGPPPQAPNYTLARTYFAKVSSLNKSFAAPQTFAQKQVGVPSTPTPTPSQREQEGAPISFLPIGLVAGLVVLVVILVLVTWLSWRAQKRRRELARFAVEQAEAERQAVAELQRQHAQSQQSQQPSEVPCPNCHKPVHLNDPICPFCRFPLSPTASGLGVRLMGTAPLPSISDQPTIQFPPNAPAAANGESGNTTIKRQKTVSEATTMNFQQMRGRNLSLAVGTRSDPGIKRKHKPNEDSLFAMQGARTHNSQPQQFGLFVVADGMGGHANGQDASRLAIQTMIDFMLPRVSSSEQMDDDAFLRLLSDGVQNSNLAVHNRNLEAHADMGTTMTTALVVGATAYVANVGDSRTYLYREGQGLSKVTQDHSVVASLVEAGIIQPDDIYTHPKRNQIYRSLGEKPVVEVDTFKVDLQPGDKLLLCSDGLWDMTRDPLIQEVMGKPTRDPNNTSQGLIKLALDGGGEDNVSVIVVQFAESNDRTGITGVQLLAKPETVTVPNLPPL